MPKTQPSIHAQFQKAHTAGDLASAVQLARRLVKDAVFSHGLSDDAPTLTALLAGDVELGPHHETLWSVFCAQVFAALAMGIAIGQLVHPDVYVQGGGATPYRWKCDEPAVTKRATR